MPYSRIVSTFLAMALTFGLAPPAVAVEKTQIKVRGRKVPKDSLAGRGVNTAIEVMLFIGMELEKKRDIRGIYHMGFKRKALDLTGKGNKRAVLTRSGLGVAERANDATKWTLRRFYQGEVREMQQKKQDVVEKLVPLSEMPAAELAEHTLNTDGPFFFVGLGLGGKPAPDPK